jgi:hypothetical protein
VVEAEDEVEGVDEAIPRYQLFLYVNSSVLTPCIITQQSKCG